VEEDAKEGVADAGGHEGERVQGAEQV
jgi:hypothetical protein